MDELDFNDSPPTWFQNEEVLWDAYEIIEEIAAAIPDPMDDFEGEQS